MNQFVEFEGKNIDQALARASDKLNTPVERLQYDVVSYGSSGIFGLVGAKKAKIRVKSDKLKGLAQEAKEQARDLVKDAFQLEEEQDVAELEDDQDTARDARGYSEGDEAGDEDEGDEESNLPTSKLYRLQAEMDVQS